MRFLRSLFLPFFIVILCSSSSFSADLKPVTSLRDVLDQVRALDSSSKKTPAKPDPALSTVQRVEVTGNKVIPTSVILNEVFIKPGDKLDTFKLDRNASNIQSLGVFSSVSYDLQKVKDGSTIIIFKVAENPVVGRILLTNRSVVTENALLGVIKSKPNDVLNMGYLRNDIERIHQVYKDRGYFQARIQRIIPPKHDMDALEIVINEGRIATISVTGNIKTRSYVITREMTVKAGDVLQQDKLREDLRRVYNLNYFSDLQPKIVPTQDSYELLVDVTERDSSGQVTFGAGYSPQTGASIQTDLSWDNIAGTGQLVTLKGIFGLGGANSANNTRFQFRYHNPYMWPEHISFTSKLWITNGQEISGLPGATGTSRFRNEVRRGVEFDFGIPLSYEWRITHAIKWETVTISSENRHYEVNSYTLGIENDSRDVRFNPREGHYASLTVEKAFPFTSRALNFTRYDLLFRKYIPTFEKQTLALRFDYGYLASDQLVSDDIIYRPELYRVGFSDTVRGQNEDNYKTAHMRIVTSAEYRFLFNDTFSLVFFVDAGLAPQTSIKDIQYGRDFVVGKGIGVRFLMPGLGPLRLDAGSDRDGVIRLQVNVGQAF
jgi:outer membrane protein insertion porin family